MHHLFAGLLPRHDFLDLPRDEDSAAALERHLERHQAALAGIIVAFLVLWPTLKDRLDFAKQASGGDVYLVSALLAFSVMVATLTAVGLAGKRPILVEAEGGDKPQLGEIGEV